MTPAASRRRGGPLVSLAAILSGWVIVRAALWSSPFPLPIEPPPALASRSPVVEAAPLPVAMPIATPSDRAVTNAAATMPAAPPIQDLRPALLPLARPVPTVIQAGEPLATPTVAAAHQLLLLAALGRLPLPPALARAASSPAPIPSFSGTERLPLARSPARLSGDGWVLLRNGLGVIGAAALPSYGGSQAGGVIRYSLAPSSPRAPHAYFRLSRALGNVAEGEAALGLSARPLASVPLRVLGEARVQRSAGETHIRPAASVVTELPPARLPLRLEGEAYAQAGYVGGRDATPFFDAQATLERPLAELGPGELRIGGGAWAGGQRGASRLDIGPRASVRLRLGEAGSRVALDWRFRVAGEARPRSGPALTISAGF